jgi:hypothetical protein
MKPAGACVHKGDVRPKVADYFGGGGKGEGGDQDYVSGTHATGFQGQVKAAGSGIDRQGGKGGAAGNIQEPGELGFKGKGLFSGGKPPGTEYPEDRVFFLRTHKRQCKRYIRFHNNSPLKPA